MAASMWRMNGLWKGMAVALVLCALLLNSGVMGQDDAAEVTPTAPPAGSDPTAASGDPNAGATSANDAQGAGAPTDATTVSGTGDSAPSQSSEDVPAPTNQNDASNADGQSGAETSGTSATSASPVDSAAQNVPADTVPDVTCVDKSEIDESSAIKFSLTTSDCEETKNRLQALGPWCKSENCHLKIFQEGTEALMTSPDADMKTLVKALESEQIKNALGVSGVETPPPSSGSSVFVAVLLTGLVLAAALIGGYCLKTRRGTDAKGVRLAEEAYPADEQNQGNTLVSVAPLNPPPETQEKPSVNGESPEAGKTQPPPTNGQATAKTADTEL
ncbi:uncharacterized protein cd34 [Myripristis murdjan]|uniref:Uncharacterized LOC115361493 n=1 Tax=Myripristis murdjan TaxID=586833 RepID=A0A667YFR5_9TELE|nr:uncharacterized protein LOC115361493 [Myripristis murdjan]